VTKVSTREDISLTCTFFALAGIAAFQFVRLAAPTLLLPVHFVIREHTLVDQRQPVGTLLRHCQIKGTAVFAGARILRFYRRAVRRGDDQLVELGREVVGVVKVVGHGSVHRHPGVVAGDHGGRRHHPHLVRLRGERQDQGRAERGANDYMFHG
jgi:hypothetical protein